MRKQIYDLLTSIANRFAPSEEQANATKAKAINYYQKQADERFNIVFLGKSSTPAVTFDGYIVNTDTTNVLNALFEARKNYVLQKMIEA